MEAVTQGIARRDFLKPQVDPRLFPRQAPGPEPIHQDSDAVFRVRQLIDTFDAQRLPRHFAPETTIRVEVPWASTRPSRDVSLASVEMIWRVCDTTWASA